MATTGDSDADIQVGELLDADNKQRLVNLESENLRLNKGDGGAVDLQKTFALFNVGNSGGRLLLTERLDAGDGGHFFLLIGHALNVDDTFHDGYYQPEDHE